MASIGNIAAQVRLALANYAKNLAPDVPCLVIGAGSFTIPSILRSAGYAGTIKTSDVTLYSSALGAYLSGGQIDISENPHCPESFKGLLNTESALDAAASIALLLDLREYWKQSNRYQIRMVQGILREWDDLLDITREKLETYAKHLDGLVYQAKDGYQVLEESDPGHTVFVFPPAQKVKPDELLSAVIEWSGPRHREMTDQSMELYEKVATFDRWFVVLEKDMPEVYKTLNEPTAVFPRGIGKRTFILASANEKKYVVKPTIKTAPVGPLHSPLRRITGEEDISYTKLALAQSLRLNELFIGANIDYFSGGVGVSLGFLLDGQLFGKADFAPSTHQWSLPEKKPMVYLMSDLSVGSNVEKRLAKLVALCVLSEEARECLRLKYVEQFGYVVTTAFSRHPVSMKYRGIFKIHTRKEKGEGYALNYFAPFTGLTLQETFRFWGKKYCGRK